jgi:hypothetical protein
VSTSIEVGFSVYGLSHEQAQAVLGLFERVVRAEGFEGYVDVIQCDGLMGGADVRVISLEPVIFSRFYIWCPKFEERLQQEVGRLVSGAEVSFEWDYPEVRADQEAEAAAEPLPAPASWSDFAERLAIMFRAVPDGGTAILIADGNRYTQFWRSYDVLFVEIAAARFVKDGYPMAPDGEKTLAAAGWEPPGASMTAAGWEPPGASMNWQRDITVPAFTETYQQLAIQVVAALSDVLKIQNPSELKVQAWTDMVNGREPEVGVLGLVRIPNPT